MGLPHARGLRLLPSLVEDEAGGPLALHDEDHSDGVVHGDLNPQSPGRQKLSVALQT